MINKNIKYLRRKNGRSQQELADIIKVSRTSLGDYERGRTEPDIKTLIMISDYFSVSIDDMVRKDLQKEDYEIMRNKHMRILAITIDKNNKENIELVESKAEAGYIENFNDPEYICELPKIYFPLIPEGTFRGFEIRGNSMLPMEPGSIVICSYIENIIEIKDDKTYVVISNEGGIVYKRVKKLQNENKLLLTSDNPEYEPYTIDYESISEIWQYYAYISKSDPISIMKFIKEEKLEEMGKKIDEIHQEIKVPKR